MIDNLLIQKIADNELPITEQRLILRTLSAEDPSWRKIALALMEDRAFRNASVDYLSAAVPVRVHAANSKRISALVVDSNWSRLVWAATILCVFTFSAAIWGWNRSAVLIEPDNVPRFSAGDPLKDDQAKSTMEAGQIVRREEVPVSSDEVPATTTLSFIDPLIPGDLPVYVAKEKEVEDWFVSENQKLNRWSASFKTLGYAVNVQPHRIERRLPDGRELIIPYHEIEFVSVQ